MLRFCLRFALPANFLSFGILGVIGMSVLAVYTLILYRIPIHKEGGDRYSLKEGDRRNQKVNLKEIWAAPLSAYGVNPCDEKTVEYFKSVMRNRGKGKRRAMFLSWIAPLSAFVIGMVFIALEIEIVAEIIFPIAYYIALLLILNFRNLLFVQIYMLTGIRFFACPKCHIVDANGYALAETSRREYDFDTVVKSHTGERTVGTVYDANGEKVGSVTQSYTTQTCRRGTRHETLSTYYCVHCHNKVMSSSHYDTNVETYTV